MDFLLMLCFLKVFVYFKQTKVQTKEPKQCHLRGTSPSSSTNKTQDYSASS